MLCSTHAKSTISHPFLPMPRPANTLPTMCPLPMRPVTRENVSNSSIPSEKSTRLGCRPSSFRRGILHYMINCDSDIPGRILWRSLRQYLYSDSLRTLDGIRTRRQRVASDSWVDLRRCQFKLVVRYNKSRQILSPKYCERTTTFVTATPCGTTGASRRLLPTWECHPL